MKLVYILLVLVVLKCIVTYKVYHSIPVHELKRRARTHDKRSEKLYKVAAFRPSLDVLLWVIGTASAAALFIWSARTNIYVAAAVIAVTAWLVVWAKFAYDSWAGGFAAIFAPYHAWFLSFANPVLSRLASWLPPGRKVHIHTGLYEKKDLLELLNKQNKQIDNRIPDIDLRIASNAINFGEKTVGSIMTPRRKVKLVKNDESAGPLLMDELHKSGFSHFPVIKNSAKTDSPQVVGVLYLNDLIGNEGTAKVKDLARKGVYYINEDSSLQEALSAFLKTHHHLLIVINSFEEMVGTISLSDIIGQIIGLPADEGLEDYQDLHAVAAKDSQKQPAEQAVTEDPA